MEMQGIVSTDKEILDWISPLNFWTTHQDISRQRHAGTGNWFLEDPKFQSWLEGLEGNKRVLWCPGDRMILCVSQTLAYSTDAHLAGSGKTILRLDFTVHLYLSFWI